MRDEAVPDQIPKPRGVFIVLEGTEGSGKAIQLAMLEEQLEADGHQVARFDFPQYDEASGYFIKQYRKGEYGNVEDIDPYSASLFYALDQFDAANRIRLSLDEGKVVLCSHFAASNMARQGIKLPDVEKRRGFYIWLDNLTFETLKIPRPDMHIILRVPAELSHSKLIEAYDDLIKLFPKDFKRIDCVRGGELLSNEALSKLVCEKVLPLLPEITKPAKTDGVSSMEDPSIDADSDATKALPEFKLPEGLDEENKNKYIRSIAAILETHATIVEKLTVHLSDAAQAVEIARAVLPVATDMEQQFVTIANSTELQSLLNEYLPPNHTNGHVDQLTLIAAWPRNELDLVTDIMYAGSDLSIEALRKQTDTLSYDQKLALFDAGSRTNPVLANARYTWDMVSSYDAFCSLPRNSSLQWQQLTPRLGYEVPRTIEDAELTDEFEACFDASLKLYSQLQQALPTHATLVSNAALYGHRMRWQVTYNANELEKLLRVSSSTYAGGELQNLITQMRSKLSEIHPLVSGAILK